MANKLTTVPRIDEALIAFHASWHDVDWDYWIRKADLSLDIVVFYWDKWTERHQEALCLFLQKPGTKLRFYFTDDQDPRLLKEMQGLFPDHTPERIRQKIVDTSKPLEEHIRSKGLDPEKLQVRKISHLLTYPFQIIDGRYAIVSLFEIYRDKHAFAPAYIIDMSKSPEMSKFFHKELHCLLHEKDRI